MKNARKRTRNIVPLQNRSFYGPNLELITGLGGRRGADEECKNGYSALAFRLIRNSNGFYGVELGKYLNAYCRSIDVNGKTDNTGG
jgi:hypothetical protein